MRWLLAAALGVALLGPAGTAVAQEARHVCVLEPDPSDRNAGAPVERFQRLGCSRFDVINAAFASVGWRNAFAAILCDFERQVLFSEGPAGPSTLPMLTCVYVGTPRQVRR
ncbi:hypothetical protein [Muricoccus radiodurans]|uniref:hypothetical protein n=1 Tax=Muricoccus radiodurans TaxID=2231721 RepID=UPI003CEA9E89